MSMSSLEEQCVHPSTCSSSHGGSQARPAGHGVLQRRLPQRQQGEHGEQVARGAGDGNGGAEECEGEEGAREERGGAGARCGGGIGGGGGESSRGGGGRCASCGHGDGGWRGERRGAASDGGGGLCERSVGDAASVAAAQPAVGISREAGAEDEARDAAGASEPRELRRGEPATQPELGQGLSALRIAELHHERGDDNPREPNFAKEDDEPSAVNAHISIAQQFAHHKPGLARLNNGSYGSCPHSVLAAQAAWSQWWLRQPDEFYFGPLEQHLHDARKEVADLIHAPVEEVVLLENVTAVASMVALDVMWAFTEGRYTKGDSILTLNFTYGAVKKAFQAYAARAGARILEVKIPFPVASSKQILETFEEALKGEQEANPSGRIRLAVFDHIVSMPTMILPVRELVKLCRSFGVEQIFIDGAHGIGNLELDMKEIDADYYTSNLHKWMFAPTTAAFLHCKPQHLSRLHHPIISHLYGAGIVAECSWVGTRDYSALLAVPAAIKFGKDVAGSIEAYSGKNHENVIAMAEMLASAWGTHLGTPPEMCAAMAMVALPPALNIHSQADMVSLRRRLREEYEVEVHVFFTGKSSAVPDEATPQDRLRITSYMRISHQIYNKRDEYLKLRDAINDIAMKVSLSQ